MILETPKHHTTIIYISSEVFQQAFIYLTSNSSKKKIATTCRTRDQHQELRVYHLPTNQINNTLELIFNFLSFHLTLQKLQLQFVR